VTCNNKLVRLTLPNNSNLVSTFQLKMHLPYCAQHQSCSTKVGSRQITKEFTMTRGERASLLHVSYTVKKFCCIGPKSLVGFLFFVRGMGVARILTFVPPSVNLIKLGPHNNTSFSPNKLECLSLESLSCLASCNTLAY
jgi:hypothetical protein